VTQPTWSVLRGRGLVLAVLLLQPAALAAEPIVVRRTEGAIHGFLVLRTLEGKTLADGDLIQVARGHQVTSRLTFRFRDGSLHDETTVFRQQRHFRLVRTRLVQKGPAFPRPLEMTIDHARGRTVVRYTDDGEPNVETEETELPADLANGMILTLVKNLRPDGPPAIVSMIAATPEPRLVKLRISASGNERFSTGTTARRATRFVVTVELGGLSGLLAPLLGKQPPDSHVWVLGGEAPAFVRSEQPLYAGGPLWRIELTSPVWPSATHDTR
jgi:hypothetical protein